VDGSVATGPAKTLSDEWNHEVSLTRVSLHVGFRKYTLLFMMNEAAICCQCDFLTRWFSEVKGNAWINFRFLI
jgi:hypothetical protein